MGDDAAPTELAGVAELQTESVQAWALDYDDYEPPRGLTPRRITGGALAVSLMLIASAGAVAILVIRGVWRADPTTPPTATTTTVTTAATTTPTRAQPLPPAPWITPTKPVTVTVQAPPSTVDAPPPAGITVEQVAAYDQQFVANLQARGWKVWDSLVISQQAHKVCAALERGMSPQSVVQQLISGGQTPPSDAEQFVTTAMLTYPACP